MVMLELGDNAVSVSKRCELLAINRGRLYYQPEPIDIQEIEIMNEIRNIYEETPFYGYRRMHNMLQRRGYVHNIKKTLRLMRLTGLRAIYPGRDTTIANSQHKKYPYLLKGMDISRPNQVWQVDISYIKLRRGFGYLVCLIDVFSRRIMGWAFSPFMDAPLCLEALRKALHYDRPEIINSDQGSQFTGHEWIEALTNSNILISMDGKGRWADNIYVERLWRSVKYEAVYLHSFDTMEQAREGLAHYIIFYNQRRPHQSLDYKTPNEFYFDSINIKQTFIQEMSDPIDYSNKGGELSQI